MANIDSARLLKANPVENLSSFTSSDQVESLSDQPVTSFPDELQAAKQSSRDNSIPLEGKDQNSRDSQTDLQNLPVNAPIAPSNPANIAVKPQNTQKAPQGDLAPGSPTLTQLEIAQAIGVEDASTSQLTPSLLAVVTQDAQGVSGDQSDAEKILNGTPSTGPDVTVPSAIVAAQNSVGLSQTNAVIPPLVADSNAGLGAVRVAIMSQSVTSRAVVTSTNDLVVTSANDVNVRPQVSGSLEAGEQGLTIAGGVTNLSVDPQTKSSINASTAIVVSDTKNSTIANNVANTDNLQVGLANQNATDDVIENNSVAGSAGSVTPATAVITSDVANLNKANLAANTNATEVANTPDVSKVEQVRNYAGATQINPSAQSVVLGSVNADKTQVSGDKAKLDTNLQDVAKTSQTQMPPVNSLRVETRSVFPNDSGETIQNMRIENAKITGMNAEKSAASDLNFTHEKSKTDIKDQAQAASGNAGSGFVDLNSKGITSPFNQELRLAQSSQVLRLEPQQASLASGPLHVEVMRVLKEGGGRVIMEVTPPDQGSIQLDLRLDGNGRAYLIVEGASDSTKARLEQGGSQLKEQLAQMGLSLNLDMRDRSSQSNQTPFALNNQFINAANGSGAQANSGIEGIVPISQPGLSSDGRVSIYA